MASFAALTAAGESCSWAMTSQSSSMSDWAASWEVGGSNHALVHLTLNVASGLTERAPSTMELIDRTTSGIGNAATYPIVSFSVTIPAAWPAR